MPELKKLTLLHSNDMHGDFLAKKVDEGLIGGVSMLSGYVNRVRRDEENVIYVIAGDMFQGSVIDAEYKGISTIEIMNLLAPNVVTIGNHEVDYGVAHLLFIEKCARFPIINANMFITTNHARLFRPYIILNVGGMKILFIGVITEEAMAQAKLDKQVGSFVDVAEAAREVGRICNNYQTEDIDFTVVMTHIGIEKDKELAAQLMPEWGVDIIVGGHSHTLLDEPVVVNGIPIVQAATGTGQIGRFDIMVDTDSNCIDSFTWQCVPINGANCPRDEALEALLSAYKDRTDAKYSRIIGRCVDALTHPSRHQETTMGDLFSDLFRDSLGLDVMLLGSGSLRKPVLGPIILFRDLREVFPFNDEIWRVVVSGAQLKRMIAYMLRDEALASDEHTEFYQLSSGLSIVYDRATHSFERFDFDGEPLADGRMLTVGLQNYHYENIGSCFGIPLSEVAANRKPRMVSTSAMDIVDEGLSQAEILQVPELGRLVIK